MKQIIMASDCTNNRYSQKDAIADRQYQAAMDEKEKRNLWIYQDQRIGVLTRVGAPNNEAYYIHNAKGEYIEIQLYANVDEVLKTKEATA